MNRTITDSVFLVAMTGCGPSEISDSAQETWAWFPLDGDRAAKYVSSDPIVSYSLLGSNGPDSEIDGMIRIHTIIFMPICSTNGSPCDVDANGDGIKDFERHPAFIWKISSDSSNGVLFHAYNDIIFEPPIRIASPDMSIGEVLTTESGGISYTSTFESYGSCDVPYWPEDPPTDCILFRVVNDSYASPIAGFLKAIYNFGVVQFMILDDTSIWSMTEYESSR